MLGVGVRVLADNPLKPLGGGGRIVHEYIIAHLGRCSFSNSLLPEGESLACSSNNVFSLEEIPFSYAENFCCLIWTPSAYPEYFLLLSGAMAPHFFYCCFPKTILVWPDPPPLLFRLADTCTDQNRGHFISCNSDLSEPEAFYAASPFLLRFLKLLF